MGVDVTRDAATARDLLDETSEAWTSVERAIWPDGPAHGTGSGAYAALKVRVIAALTLAATAPSSEEGTRETHIEPLPDGISICGTDEHPHWHAFGPGPDFDGRSYASEAAARAVLASPATRAVEPLREALEAIIDLPCVVPDHPHGGVHPPYLEWQRVAAIARAALSAASGEPDR